MACFSLALAATALLLPGAARAETVAFDDTDTRPRNNGGIAAKLASVHSMDARQRVGLNIQRIRRSRGLSQEELAARANAHQTYLSGVESGRRNPTVLVLDKIANALETDLSDVIGRPQK